MTVRCLRHEAEGPRVAELGSINANADFVRKGTVAGYGMLPQTQHSVLRMKLQLGNQRRTTGVMTLAKLGVRQPCQA